MAVLKFYGEDWLLKNSQAELINKSKRGNELYKIENLFKQTEYFLKYKCPSTNRLYVKCVEKADTADEAQAKSFGWTLEQYNYLKVES